MDHPLIDLISRQIKEAQARGEFDNLAGAGKPLDPNAKSLLDRLIQESGGTHPLAVLQDQISQSKKRLATLTGDARKAEMKILTDLELKRALEIEAAKKRL